METEKELKKLMHTHKDSIPKSFYKIIAELINENTRKKDEYNRGYAEAAEMYNCNRDIKRLLENIEIIVKQVKSKIDKEGYKQLSLLDLKGK